MIIFIILIIRSTIIDTVLYKIEVCGWMDRWMDDCGGCGRDVDADANADADMEDDDAQ